MKNFWQQHWPVIIMLGLISGLLLLINPTASSSQKLSAPVLVQSYPRLVVGPTASQSDTIPSSAPARTSVPLRLKIPRLQIDAAVEAVGLTPQGAMGVPKNTSDVAWFSLGPWPGETGSAVISGHLDWYNGATAVFNNLYKLHPGDKIYIIDGSGASKIFVVRKSQLYAADAEATPIFSSAAGAHLNLVTCAGVWNKFKNSYTKRLVIFTDLQP
jgi:sortase (surface protein transpeptidase)